jgi:hypothetical protein
MNSTKRIAATILVVFALLVSIAPTLAPADAKSKKKNKETATGTPVFWRNPTDIASRNLLLGPGGTSMRPDLSEITFIKEEKAATRRSIA